MNLLVSRQEAHEGFAKGYIGIVCCVWSRLVLGGSRCASSPSLTLCMHETRQHTNSARQALSRCPQGRERHERSQALNPPINSLRWSMSVGHTSVIGSWISFTCPLTPSVLRARRGILGGSMHRLRSREGLSLSRYDSLRGPVGSIECARAREPSAVPRASQALQQILLHVHPDQACYTSSRGTH